MVGLIKTSERRQSIRLLKLVFILCTIAVVGLSVVDTLWFNAMPESNRYKNVQAFNVVTLWIVAIVLIIKLVTM